MAGDRIQLAVDAPLSWRGRACVVRGIDPMSVTDRRVELEDVDTGERFRVGLADLRGTAPGAV